MHGARPSVRSATHSERRDKPVEAGGEHAGVGIARDEERAVRDAAGANLGVMSAPPGLFYAIQVALGLTQREIGALLGYSRRTIVRWTAHGTGAIDADWCTLARAVHPKDPELAARAAKAAGETLQSLGIVPATPPAPVRPPLATADLVELVVHAAADAVDMAPRAIRPALLAALDRMAAVGLTGDEARDVLRAAASKKPKKG